jgi:hypothetical protein
LSRRVFARTPPEEIQIEANLRHDPRQLQNKPSPIPISHNKLRIEPNSVPTHDRQRVVLDLQNEPGSTATDNRQLTTDN